MTPPRPYLIVTRVDPAGRALGAPHVAVWWAHPTERRSLEQQAPLERVPDDCDAIDYAEAHAVWAGYSRAERWELTDTGARAWLRPLHRGTAPEASD